MRDSAAHKLNPEVSSDAVSPKPIEKQVTGQNLLDGQDSPWQARVYGDYTELETMWRQLEARGSCTIFQTYDWAACWYDTAISCGEAEPVIVVVTKNNNPVWILPLCLYRRNGLRIISFADLGVSDYAAPAIAHGLSAERKTVDIMINAVLAALPPCDIVNFQKIPKQVENVSNPLVFLPNLEIFPVECHGIRLTEPWPALKEKIMQRRLRLTIRRKQKKLEEQKEVVTFERHESEEKLEPLMEDLLSARDERFNAIGRSGMPALWKNFYKNLAKRQGRNLDASITTMNIAGETVATCFGLARRNTYHALLTTFQMGKWESYRPGMLLFDEMLTKFSPGQESYFDFTVGDEVYKTRLGCESHPLYEFMMPRSLAGLAYYYSWRAKIFLRRHPRVLSALKRALSGLPFLNKELRKEWRSG